MKRATENAGVGEGIVNALSFDLEDWFHMIGIEGLEDPSSWAQFPSIFERHVQLILDDLDDFGVRATFFILGWMAEKYPDTIREVAARGHELGSHSHLHHTVYDLSPAAFRRDLQQSVDAIEKATGQIPRGFRAPSFSIVPGCDWAFDTLLDAGFEFDASLFPVSRAHGGYPCPTHPHRRVTPSGRTIGELPMSTMRLFGRTMAFSGGGYLRLLPRSAISAGFAQSHARGEPVVVYLHPRDFAPECPSVPMPLGRRFKSRIGQRTARAKFRFLLTKYKFDTCSSVLDTCLRRTEQQAYEGVHSPS